MAWRFVTHACGHQERINVDGPYVVVEQRVRNAERVSCPACIGIASRQRNRLDGFCELWGSKSQCDRAEPIRRRTLSQVDVLARHARIEDRDAFAELRRSVDGTGICKLTELDGGGEEVVVCLPDGTMPEGISDLELVRVPTRIEEGDAKTETMSDETAERMARTRFIVDEYTMGVLDEQEAGERLFRHLFPHWG